MAAKRDPAKPYPWLRLYTEIVDDEKIRLLAFEDRWHYVAILCCKRSGIIDSTDDFDLLERKLSVKLGLHPRELSEVNKRLRDVELIDSNWQPLGWDKRQFKSDTNGSERTSKSRGNSK